MTSEQTENLRQAANDPVWFVEHIIGAQPEPYQKRTLRAIAKHKKVAHRSGHGVGKCFGKGTEILLFDGTIKAVEEILPGDRVMGDDSTPRTVVNTTSGVDELYRVEYSDGTGYVVNSEHPLLLVASQTHGTQKVGDYTMVRVKDYLEWSDRRKRTNVGYKRAVSYEEKEIRIAPYTLGVWLGDGATRGPQLTNIDEEVIDAWYKEARKRGLVVRRSDSNGTRTTTYSISSGKAGGRVGRNSLLNDLRFYNLIKNKHIPHDYMTGSLGQRRELLAGLIDTDGYCGGHYFSIVQRRQNLAKQIMRLAQSCGHHATLNKRRVDNTDYWRVYISRNIFDIPTRVERKRVIESGNEQRNNLHFGFTVESLGKGRYYGFELTGNRRFLLADYSVVHNTAEASWAVLWFFHTRPLSKVITTATAWRQVKKQLWPEIHRWHKQADLHKIGCNPEEIEMLHLMMKHTEYPGWFATGEASDEGVKMEGFHAPHLMYVIDEAKAVPDETYESIEGALTNAEGEVKVLAISTPPPQRAGYFWEIFSKKRIGWETFHTSCLDSPRVSREWIEARKQEWGEDSPIYQTRVLGEFAESSEDLLIDLKYADRAIENSLERTKIPNVIVGVDVARFGSDKTVLVAREEGKVLNIEVYAKQDTMATTGKVVEMLRKYETKAVNVDVIGIGAGVVDRLSEMGYNVNGVNVADKASNSERFKNKRAEMFWGLRQRFIDGDIDIPDNDELAGQLSNIKYDYNSRGQIVIESKADMKKRGLSSPDMADALALAFLSPTVGWGDSRKKDEVKPITAGVRGMQF